MKKVVLSLMLLSAVLLSAVQPGLPSSDISFIKQFRLSAWKYEGYGFNIGGKGTNKYYNSDEFRRSENYWINFSPNADFRIESEREISEVNFDLNGNFTYNRSGDGNPTQINRWIELFPKLTMNRKNYNSNTNYINLESQVNYDYSHGNYAYYGGWSNFKDETTTRLFQISNMVGFGLGKVRDVTPVVRALRVKQRFNSLGKGNLTDKQIGDLAKVMAKEPAYNYVYDRSRKKLWDNAFTAMGSGVDQLSVYETYMLAEAMNEDVGRRFEGSDINFNLQYTWNDVNMDGKYSDYVVAYGGPVIQARTYTNVSVGHQVGLELKGAYYIPTSDIEMFDSILKASINHNQLATITDRILYNFDVTFTVESEKYGYYENSGVVLECLNKLSFYIENNLSLSLNADYRFQKFEHSTYSYDDYNYSADFYSAKFSEYGWWDFGINMNYRFRTM